MGLILNSDQVIGPSGSKSTKDQILATQPGSLEIYWPLDDAAAPVQDLSGNARDGTEISPPVSYQVAGSGGLAGNAIRFSPGDGLTSNFWTMPSTANHTLMYIFRPLYNLTFDSITGYYSGQVASECFWIWSSGVDLSRPALVYKYGAAGGVIDDPLTGSSTGDYAFGVWGMYALTRTGASSHYYRNGVRVGSGFGSATSWAGTINRPFTVGRDQLGTNGADMDIQHVAMWSTDLTESELDAIFATTGI